MRAKFILIGAALLLALPALGAEVKVGAVTLSAPWARATPGGATTAAVYLTLGLTGADGDRLVKVGSPRAERAELHSTTMAGGVMRMSMIEALELKPGAPLVLAPSGTHIMLVGLKAPLAAGDMLPLTLTFARAGAVELKVPVLTLAAKGPDEVEPLPDLHAGH